MKTWDPPYHRQSAVSDDADQDSHKHGDDNPDGRNPPRRLVYPHGVAMKRRRIWAFQNTPNPHARVDSMVYEAIGDAVSAMLWTGRLCILPGTGVVCHGGHSSRRRSWMPKNTMITSAMLMTML